MKIPSPRVQILEKINELQNTHCEGCVLKTTGSRGTNYCVPDVCLIAKNIKTLGNLLLETKAVSVKKPKFVSEIKTFKKEVETVTVENKLTKEMLIKLKSEGNSDTKIRDSYNMSNASFYKLKNTWGLVTGKGRRPDAPIKNKTLADVTFVEEKPKQDNINELNEQKALFDKNIYLLKEVLSEKDDYILRLQKLRSEDVEVIDKFKEKIKGLEVDNNYLKEDFKITIEKLNHANETIEIARGNIKKLNNTLQSDNDFFVKTLDEKNAEIDTLKTISKSFDKERENILNTIQPMQEELNRLYNQQKNYSKNKEKLFRLESLLDHSEKTNDSLIAQIKSLSKFKTMYFKTAETLKLHLPN